MGAKQGSMMPPLDQKFNYETKSGQKISFIFHELKGKDIYGKTPSDE
jgi:hypothetical protein